MAKGKIPSVEVGQKYTSVVGEAYEVVEYRSAVKGVVIKFESTGSLMTCSAKEVRNGSVKNAMQRTVYGVGCFGIRPYKAKISGKFTPEYQVWIGMMSRVYRPESWAKHPTYRNTTVCVAWLNFQVFAEWCQDKLGFNKKEVAGRAYHLDKDILIPNNYEYSPEACCFLPNHINVALKGRQLNKAKELPAGVHWHNASQSYTACVQTYGKQNHLGCFSTIDAARKAYRKAKKAYLLELAETYKAEMSPEAYEALVNIDLDKRTEYEYA